MVIDRGNCVGNNLISIRNDRKKESKIIDKFNKLHNSRVSILVERSNIVFVAQ